MVKKNRIAEYNRLREFENAIESGELVQVVRGRWNSMRDNPECDTIFVCSNCGETWVLNDGTPKENNMNYCPNCGANMGLEGSDAE